MPLEIFLLKNGISSKNLYSIAVRDKSRFQVIKHIGRVSYFPSSKIWYVNCDLLKYSDYIRKGAKVNHKVINLIPWEMFKDWVSTNKERTLGLPLTNEITPEKN
jgi:ribosomal protein S16